jgi:hypothetical protein
MGASLIIKEVHMEHFCEPDDSIVFEDNDAPHGRPARIDVFVWGTSAETDITTFSTIGMATSPMSGADHRHSHSAEPGHCVAQCHDPASPYYATDYVLRLGTGDRRSAWGQP